jgi:hypothetical protein
MPVNRSSPKTAIAILSCLVTKTSMPENTL